MQIHTLLMFVFPALIVGQFTPTEITNENFSQYEYFGRVVTVDDDVMVACGNVAIDSELYYYKKTGPNTWDNGTSIQTPAGFINFCYGSRGPLLRGNKLFVGSRDNTNYDEHIHIYTYLGGVFVEDDILNLELDSGVGTNIFNVENYDYDPTSGILVLGAEGSGHALIYEYTGGVWYFRQVHSTADSFGSDVCVTGTTVFVGCYDEEVATNFRQGKVYVYDRSGNSWVETTTITTPTPGTAYFGLNVACHGDYLLVHENQRDLVRTYHWNGAAWNYDGQVTGGANFGNSLIMDSDQYFLAKGDASNFKLFERSGISWTLNKTITQTMTSTDQLDVDTENQLIVSSDSTWQDVGRVFIYEGFGDFTAPTEAPTTSPTTLAPTDAPTSAPTDNPTSAPTSSPTVNPTEATMPPTSTPNGTVVSAIEIAFEIKNETDMETAVSSINDALFNLYPGDSYRALEKIVSVTISGAFSSQLYDIVNNEALLYDSIKETKCGTASEYCSIINPSARRMLGTNSVFSNEYQFELVIEIDMGLYSMIDGTNVDDPAFITALESTLGLTHDDAYTVTSIDNKVIIGVTLIVENENNEPLPESLIDTVEDIYSNITVYTTDLVENLGVNGDYVSSTDIIRCPVERTCGGQGNDKCNADTGVCECDYFNNNYWWGIDCETPCECNNGGSCVKGVCHCTFPQWGLRCDNTHTDCQQCTA
jgi:hypothetical protein